MGKSKHMTASEKQERRVHWERRTQSVLLAIATGAILWALDAVLESRTDIAGIKPRIDSLDLQIGTMYRASDARRDVAEMLGRISAVEARQENIEVRVRTLESAPRGEVRQ
jgi:hypothetical protein